MGIVFGVILIILAAILLKGGGILIAAGLAALIFGIKVAKGS